MARSTVLALLAPGRDVAAWSLGQDFATAATARQAVEGPKLLARLTDRWLIGMGREPRYVEPTKRWPAVRRDFGLLIGHESRCVAGLYRVGETDRAARR